MKRLQGIRVSADFIKAHHHVCDLVNSEYPILSLVTDGRANWLYLWCDTDGSRHRWLLFRTTRELLVEYLDKKNPLLKLVTESTKLLALDEGAITYADAGTSRKKLTKRLLKRVSLEDVSDYLPADDSYFDEELTRDLDLTKQIVPSLYDLPIDGSWFGKDFEHLFKRYERVYAFFYATRPQFVTTIGGILERCLRAPWMGGASRVHLYSQLAQQIPAIHSLRVKHLAYGSPGAIRFEALPSIGESIAKTTTSFIENEDAIARHFDCIQKILTNANLRSEDLSAVADASVPLNDDKKSELKDACASIATVLDVESEFAALVHHSPNVVVFSKAVQSFVRQLTLLAAFQADDMVKFSPEAHANIS